MAEYLDVLCEHADHQPPAFESIEQLIQKERDGKRVARYSLYNKFVPQLIMSIQIILQRNIGIEVQK